MLGYLAQGLGHAVALGGVDGAGPEQARLVDVAHHVGVRQRLAAEAPRVLVVAAVQVH